MPCLMERKYRKTRSMDCVPESMNSWSPALWKTTEPYYSSRRVGTNSHSNDKQREGDHSHIHTNQQNLICLLRLYLFFLPSRFGASYPLPALFLYIHRAQNLDCLLACWLAGLLACWLEVDPCRRKAAAVLSSFWLAVVAQEIKEP